MTNSPFPGYSEEITEIAVDLVDIDGNPRRDPGELAELAASIRRRGVMEPIRVRSVGDRYRLVYGSRRLLASRMAERKTIPAIIAGADGQNDMADALVENIQRKDLNPIEEARAIEALHELGHTEVEIAAMLSRTQGFVSSRRRLLRLDPAVMAAVETGRLPVFHGVLMATLPHQQQRTLADRAQREKWDQERLKVALKPFVRPPGRPSKEAQVISPPRGAEAYAAALMKFKPVVPDTVARLVLWMAIEQDAMIQHRFEQRHQTGWREETWTLVSRMPSSSLVAELAQVIGEFLVEYGSAAVRAAIPTESVA